MHRVVATLVALALLYLPGLAAESYFSLPNTADSLKFAVIGDNGTGEQPQYDIGAQMARAHGQFRFELVIMLGDNFYGRQRPADLEKKFERPYKPLLDAGVVFHAALGNHDELHTVEYPPINMNGRRYYSFARQNVRFFVLDTNALDSAQLHWFEAALAASRDEWKICYFHHPLYSSAGRHGAAVDMRILLEPLLVRHGVHVVFSGHDHVYERLHPQNGIHYFVSGSGGQLREGDLRPGPLTAAGFDKDRSFMLVEIDGTELHFLALSRTGASVDAGMFRRPAGRSGTW